MSEIQGTKLLRKLTDGALFGLTDETTWVAYGDGWEVYTNSSGKSFGVLRTYFDIAGWSSEQLSAFIDGIGWQESDSFAVPSQATIGPSPVLHTWDLVTKAAIPNEALEDEHWLIPADAIIWFAPGMSRSHYDLEEVFGGRHRNFTPDSTVSYAMVKTDENIWGAANATAGDKIYITRIVKLSGLQIYPGQVYIPPQNIIANAIVVDEKDLVYMERLRRSYVLGESRNP